MVGCDDEADDAPDELGVVLGGVLYHQLDMMGEWFAAGDATAAGPAAVRAATASTGATAGREDIAAAAAALGADWADSTLGRGWFVVACCCCCSSLLLQQPISNLASI
jgi:hypothetical protein